jgi:hypothetical protein
MSMRTSYPIAFALICAGCGAQPPVAPAPAAPPPLVSMADASAFPPASATSGTSAQPSVCIPKRLRTEAWVADAWLSGSEVAVCLSASEKANGCWAVDPATSVWRPIAARSKPARWPHLSAGGTHTLDASAKTINVCEAATAQCRVIVAQGFGGAATDEFSDEISGHVPSDVSPDGKQLLLVRHEGKRSEKVFGETYDLKSGKRQSRFAIKADQHVDRVVWLGRLALLTICVDEGPGCHGVMVDTRDGKVVDVPPGGPGPINLFGVEEPCHHVQGDLWACVAATGAEVAFIHADDGRKDALMNTAHEASLEAGVEVIRLSAERIAIVSGAPVGGDALIVDLNAKRVTSTLAAPACEEPAAGDAGK